jgi:hypothetical protein
MPGYFSTIIPPHPDGWPMATADHHDPTPHAPALARRLIWDEWFALPLDRPLQ